MNANQTMIYDWVVEAAISEMDVATSEATEEPALSVMVVKTDDAEQLPISMTSLAVPRPASTRPLPAQTSRADGRVAMYRLRRAI